MVSGRFDIISEKWDTTLHETQLLHGSSLGRQTAPIIKWDDTLQLLYLISVDGVEFYDFRDELWRVALQKDDIWKKISGGVPKLRMSVKDVVTASNK